MQNILSRFKEMPLPIKVVFTLVIIVTIGSILSFIEMLFDWENYSQLLPVRLVWILLNVFIMIGLYGGRWFKFILSVLCFYMIAMVALAILALTTPQEGGFIIIHDLPEDMCQGNINPDHPDFPSWPYGNLPEEMKQFLKEQKLIRFNLPTPRDISIFYKPTERYQRVKL